MPCFTHQELLQRARTICANEAPQLPREVLITAVRLYMLGYRAALEDVRIVQGSAEDPSPTGGWEAVDEWIRDVLTRFEE